MDSYDFTREHQDYIFDQTFLVDLKPKLTMLENNFKA